MQLDGLALSVARTLHAALAPLRVRLAAADEVRQRHEATIADLTATATVLRERLAVLETRAPVPGPSGPAGRDGLDGLGVADFDVAYDGERTITCSWSNNDRRLEKAFRLPVPIYRGQWTEGRTYDVGDTVTHQRSTWTCQATTGTRPDTSAQAWQLSVMRGRDGRDAK